MTALESTKKGMFKNENPISENKQIEVGHDKKPRVDAKDKFKKKREKLKKRKKLKKKRREENIELYHVRGIFGQTSCEKNVIKIIESPR